MTSDLPETLEVHKAIPARVNSGASLGGHNAIDAQGRWIVQLSIHDDAGSRLVNLLEGETFDFAGTSWQVSKINEPTTSTRGLVAKLTRV